jgi:hypothetical protein
MPDPGLTVNLRSGENEVNTRHIWFIFSEKIYRTYVITVKITKLFM